MSAIFVVRGDGAVRACFNRVMFRLTSPNGETRARVLGECLNKGIMAP